MALSFSLKYFHKHIYPIFKAFFQHLTIGESSEVSYLLIAVITIREGGLGTTLV